MTLRDLCPLIVIGATLCGCANSASIHRGPAEQTIQVEQRKQTLFLPSLRGSEKRQLRSFIANVSGGRRDALHVDVIGSHRLIAEVAHEARAMGVAPYNIRLFAAPLDLPSPSGARIEAITFEARLPYCPSLLIVGPAANDNAFEPTLGCSTKSNLAVMANDPLDLLENRSVITSNGDRAAIPLASYGTFAPRNKNNAEDGGGAVAPDTAGTTAPNAQPLR
ncbi:CpaD family pilus assembly lipoprotein [Bradyrhizobium sp. CCBAU 45384]|uniref:CpaD family pilus assembly lipoprotein n=1 Tax=Bradyrhizobium sp. CCBAU 45384 TaxID=858428 RepID=UPI0023052160|nr:CpaD family pilus assembly lipoprotein [Bradyrhizobium sp. CCBAU 45384]MDA9408861.1 hypothetical protein [Bradyrhizobium sp. CCBAU 45384]